MAATAFGTTDRAARDAFDAFFTAHHREFARLAYLLSGDADAAEDITAEAFAQAWLRWDKVARADSPTAYVRRIVVNLAADRIRGLTRERRGRLLLGATWPDRDQGPDLDAVADVRAALARLPARKRACVVLRHCYGLSEAETARTLGISVGTVKSQTSRGVAELAALLGAGDARDGLDEPRGRARRGAGAVRP